MIIELILFTVTLFLTWGFMSQKRPTKFPPGPWGVPILGNLPFLGSESHIGINKYGEKYGKIFSLNLGSIPVVVLNDIDVIKKGLKSDALDGRPIYLPAMDIAKGGTIYNIGTSWKEQRRFVLGVLRDFGFGKSAMCDIVQSEVGNLVQHLKDNVKSPIYPREIYQISFINSLWAILTGENYSLDDPLVKRFQRLTYETYIEPPAAGAFYFLPWVVKWFPKWIGFTKVVEMNNEIQEFFRNKIRQNASTYSEEISRHFADVYWKKMQETSDPNSSFYGKEGEHNFVWNLVVLFVAGSDTLSSTLSWATLYMTTFPEVCEKVYNEIVQVVGKNDLPSASQRASMPYTEATMSEILRMSSILPGSVLHDTTRAIELEGYHIPKHTVIIPNLGAVHHSKDLWGDPENFRPERFLSKDENGKIQFQKSDNLIPFSYGRRVCIAEGMAMNELFLYFTGLVQNFQFQFDPKRPKPGLESNGGIVLAPKRFYVNFIPRNK